MTHEIPHNIRLVAVSAGSDGRRRLFHRRDYQAKSIQQTDLPAAIEGMKRSFHLAVAAGNADYATSAGLNAAYMVYQRDQSAEAGRFAREVILALDHID